MNRSLLPPPARRLALVAGVVFFRTLAPAGAEDPGGSTRERAMWVYQTEALVGSPAAGEEPFTCCRERDVADLFWQVFAFVMYGACRTMSR